jgi:hypothetical protein
LPTAALVSGSIRTTVLEASTQRTPSATAMVPAPGRGMAAANRPRSKAGTVAPVSVGAGGGGVDRGLLGMSAASEQPVTASSTATTSVCQGGTRRGGGRRVAGPAMAHLPSRDSRLRTLSTSPRPGRFPAMKRHGVRRRQLAGKRFGIDAGPIPVWPGELPWWHHATLRSVRQRLQGFAFQPPELRFLPSVIACATPKSTTELRRSALASAAHRCTRHNT